MATENNIITLSNIGRMNPITGDTLSAATERSLSWNFIMASNLVVCIYFAILVDQPNIKCFFMLDPIIEDGYFLEGQQGRYCDQYQSKDNFSIIRILYLFLPCIGLDLFHCV